MSTYERVVELYRAESLPIMRDHWFRVALTRLGPAELASLVEVMTEPQADELRAAVAAECQVRS